jgi:lipopolysaccharide export system permease LptF/LptG-like protein
VTPPGSRLQALSARLCSAAMMKRLVDPVIADMQAEYAEALGRGRVWESRWVRLAGYTAFAKVIALHAGDQSLRPLREWTAEDDTALGRTIKYAGALIGALTVFFNLPLWLRVSSWIHSSDVTLLGYLFPHAIVVAIPVGFTLGIVCGLGGRPFSRRLVAPVLAASLVCSAASFATQIWIVPAANDALRHSLVDRRGMVGSLKPGPSQRELRQAIALYSQAGPDAYGQRLTAQLRLAYHFNWAVSGATFCFALFALSLATRRSAGPLMLAGATASAFAGYYWLCIFAATFTAGALPPYAIAWLPNAVLAATSAALLVLPGGPASPPTRNAKA